MPTAVLLSGGLDSAVLLAEEAAAGEVQPIYISVGLAWEAAERDAVRHFLADGISSSNVRPLVALSVDMAHISSVKVQTGLMLSDVLVETSGGASPIRCHGHRTAFCRPPAGVIGFNYSHHAAGSGQIVGLT